MSEPLIHVWATMPADRDVIEVRIVRYSPLDLSEYLDPDTGWVAYDHEDHDVVIPAVFSVYGQQLSINEPLRMWLRALTDADRAVTVELERAVEAAVLRTLAGNPAWFPKLEIGGSWFIKGGDL